MIRVTAVCLLQNAGRVLCSKNFDSVKNSTFYRLLGGGVERGETTEEAVVREIQEEVGAEIQNLKLLQVIENIFWLEGAM